MIVVVLLLFFFFFFKQKTAYEISSRDWSSDVCSSDLLVAPLAAYEFYYRERAQLWEIHALTRARPISGQLQDACLEMVQRIWRGVGQQSDLFAKIDHMLERIRRERGSGSDFLDLKTGTGGMIEAEFLVQALQMRSGIWEPNWQRALIALRENKMISDPSTPNRNDLRW